MTIPQRRTVEALEAAGYLQSGIEFDVSDVFGGRNNQDNAHRRNMSRLAEKGYIGSYGKTSTYYITISHYVMMAQGIGVKP